MHQRTLARLSATWAAIAGRYTAYRLVLPGDASFICQAELCGAHCCRAFSVSLGDAEVARLARASGWQPAMFLEYEDGEPISLPLARPYLLARTGDHCKLLAPSLACGQYEGRPHACRLYPHQVLPVEEGSLRPLQAAWPRIAAAVGALLSDEDFPKEMPLPLLLRHIECPGFTGPPLDEPAWADLLRATSALQYGRDAAAAALPSWSAACRVLAAPAGVPGRRSFQPPPHRIVRA
ncbi:MAG: YkgJ family cysteine cluster protein, partial [Tepidiformaceae bacterium]